MAELKQTELLSLQSADIEIPTPFCPEDQQIAEFYEGALSDAERASVEHHVADCRICSARIGILARLEAGRHDIRVPADALATAKQMRRPSRMPSRHLMVWAAAAVLVLALGIYFQPPGTRQVAVEPGVQDFSHGTVRDTRNVDVTPRGPVITSPGENQLAGVNAEVRWTAVPNSLFYHVRVVSDEGDLLWQERVEGTSWQVPDGLGLTPGAEFFVRIDAYLTEAKSLQSEYLLIRYGNGG